MICWQLLAIADNSGPHSSCQLTTIAGNLFLCVDCWQLWTIANNFEQLSSEQVKITQRKYSIVSEMPTIANNLREYMVRDVRVGWDLLTYDNNF